MIIDAHTHIHPRADGFGKKFDASVGGLIGSLQESPADMAVVLAIAPEIPNEFVAEACAAHPARLIGFASVDPYGGAAAQGELRVAVEKMGLRGLKIHPRRQNVGLDKVELLVPLVACAAELRIPVLIDAFPCGQDWFRIRELELISVLAERNPDARIILAHAGGHRVFDAMLVAKAHANVWVDISFTPTYYQNTSVEQDLVQVMGKLGSKRLIYGSDHPEVSMLQSCERALKLLRQTGFDEDGIADVMGGNMRLLLSWRSE